MWILVFLLAVSCLALPAGADHTGAITLIVPDDELGAPYDPTSRGTDIAPDYLIEEFLVEGEATVYNYPSDPPVRDEILPIPALTNVPYRTRLMVRRPADAADFGGTVVIEWWNSTAGFDTAQVWDPSHDYFRREGVAYVGWTNSNQAMSFLVGGCTVSILPMLCGTRYESLFLPDDGQAYEIGSQIANALKNGPSSPLPEEFLVERVFHAGYSQQGGSMVTYASAFHLPGVNDGYFVQAFGGARDIKQGLPCSEPGAEPFPDCPRQLEGEQRLVRTDLPVPVIRSHTETDVAAGLFGAPPQADTETFRYYEMAGTAHATLQDDPFLGLPIGSYCHDPVNTLADGPVFGSFLHNAMWENMVRQVIDGVAPPQAELIERENDEIVRDEFGNARGGVRLPDLDVPIASYGPTNMVGSDVPRFIPANLIDLFCRLAGTAIPLDPEQLGALYPTPQDYLTAYEAHADALVAARFLLPEDAETLKTIAAPEPGVTLLRLGAGVALVLAAAATRRSGGSL